MNTATTTPAASTLRRTPAQRLAASSLALLMTLAMLGSVDLLATSSPTPAQLARAAAEAPRG